MADPLDDFFAQAQTQPVPPQPQAADNSMDDFFAHASALPPQQPMPNPLDEVYAHAQQQPSFWDSGLGKAAQVGAGLVAAPLVPGVLAGMTADFFKAPLQNAGKAIRSLVSPQPQTPEEQAQATDRQPGNVFSKALDVGQRGLYGSTKAIGTLVNEATDPQNMEAAQHANPSLFAMKIVKDALLSGAAEVVDPKSRWRAEDLIKQSAPAFAKRFPVTTALVGAAEDTALDPLTYATSAMEGAYEIADSAGKKVLLNKAGQKLLADTEQIAQSPDAVGLAGKVADFGAKSVSDQISNNTFHVFRAGADEGRVGAYFNLKYPGFESTYIGPDGRTIWDTPAEISEAVAKPSNPLIFKGYRTGGAVSPGLRALEHFDPKTLASMENMDQQAAVNFIKSKLPPNFALNPQASALGAAEEYGAYLAKQAGHDMLVTHIGGAFGDAGAESVVIDRNILSPITSAKEAAYAVNARVTAEAQTARMLSVDPELAKQLTVNPEEMVTAKAWQAIKDRSNALANKLQSVNPNKFGGRAANKVGDIFAEAMDLGGKAFAPRFAHLEAPVESGSIGPTVQALNYMAGSAELNKQASMQAGVEALQGVFWKGTRKTITKTMMEIDDATRSELAQEAANRGMADISELPQSVWFGVSAQIRQKIVEDKLANGEINGQMLRTMNKMWDGFHEMAQHEKALGMLEESVNNPNYFPAKYLKRPKLDQARESQRIISDYFAPAQERTMSHADAISQGYVPDMDALAVYSNRVLQSKRAESAIELFDTLGKIYGIPEKITAKNAANLLPEGVMKELTFAADPNFSLMRGKGWGWTAVRHAATVADHVNNLFRPFGSVLRSAFTAKQVIGDMGRAYLVFGDRAFGALSMDALKPAILTSLMDSPNTTEEATANWAQGVWRKKTGIVGTIGELQQSITKNIGHLLSNVQDWRSGNNGLGRMLWRNNVINVISKDEATQGMMKMAAETMNYANWPGQMRNLAARSMYINALNMGYGEAQAAKLTEEAMINYQATALGPAQRQYARRIMPFFTYPRFTTAILAKTLFNAPGRISNTTRAVKTFLEVWNKIGGNPAKYLDQSVDPRLSNDPPPTLTPQERESVYPYILEQPSALVGLDPKTKAHIWNTFNHFSPLDTINMIDEGTGVNAGKVDMEATLRRSVVAQMAPWIKVPLGIVANVEDFFTGRPLHEPRSLQDVAMGKPDKFKVGYNTDPHAVLANMLTTLGAGAGNAYVGNATLGALASRFGVAPVADRLGAEALLKKALGWEEWRNPRNGKTEVYINPYVAMVLTQQIPTMSAAIRYANPEQTPMERWQDVFGQIMLGMGKITQTPQQEESVLRQKAKTQMMLRLMNPQTPSEIARQQLQDQFTGGQ